MRRHEILQGIDNIRTAAVNRGLYEVSKNLGSTGPSESEEALQATGLALTRYVILATSYSRVELEITKIFNIRELHDKEQLVMFLTAREKAHTSPLGPALYQFHFFCDQLNQVAKMFETDSFRKLEEIEAPEDGGQKELDILTVIVIEDEDEISHPDRLIRILKAISDLNEVFYSLRELPLEPLEVIGCDSGSDKSFDFLGAGAVISGIKTTIIDTYRRLSLVREMRTREQIKLVSESVSVLGEIEESLGNGALEPEDAQRLKRKVIKAVTDLLDSHVMIPELDDEARIDPRQVLAPPPKLIRDDRRERGDGQEHEPEVMNAPPPDGDQSRDVDIEIAKTMLAHLTPAQRKKLLEETSPPKKRSRKRAKK